jgi:hypothetical protein
VRREQEQLEAQRKTEEETLAQLSGNLKEQVRLRATRAGLLAIYGDEVMRNAAGAEVS